MGEFDLSLILEFRNRPCLYDRNSQQFKDKLFTAQQWQEISNKLGYDVSILKDRMLQLRNRYNLEKRRIEQLREENPEKIINSPWPLFESLQFLSGHIKARRRYKNMLPVGGCPKEEHLSYLHDSANDYSALGTDDAAMEAAKDDSRYLGIGSGGSSGGGGASACQPFPNALLAVKVEENFSDDQGSEVETDHSQNNESESNIFGENSNVMTEIHSISKSRQQRLEHLNKLQQQSQQQQLHHQSSDQLQPDEQMQQQYQHNMQQQQLHIQQQLLIRQQQQQHHQQQQQQMKQHLQQQQQQQQNHSTPISNGGILRLSTAIRGGGNDSDKQIIKSRKRSFAQLSNSIDGIGGTNGDPKRLSKSALNSSNHRQQPPVKRLSPRELKYNAFGNFVSSSLMDLPQKMALELVEKFTSDIVKALTMKMDTTVEEESGANNNITTAAEVAEVVVEE